MSALGRRALTPRASSSPLSRIPLTTDSPAAYRRISTRLLNQQAPASPRSHASLGPSLASSALRSQFLPSAISTTFTRSVSFRELQQERKRQRAGEASASKPQGPSASKAGAKSAESAPKPDAQPEVDAAEEAYRKAQQEQGFGQQKAEKESAGPDAEPGAEREGEGPEADAKKKKAAPPPPKHGNKTPWQVFTDTLQTEFKASKEWNDSQKQLAGSIEDFSQNPNVQRAKTAYSKATDAATSTTSAALKTTATAIGSGAAWTWDTTVVKGLRKGATALGSGVEKATRPVRETEAFKNVKDVIDDGSSSRYGGWVEKEERRKRREAKELREAAQGGLRHPTKPMVEDPELVPCLFPPPLSLL